MIQIASDEVYVRREDAERFIEAVRGDENRRKRLLADGCYEREIGDQLATKPLVASPANRLPTLLVGELVAAVRAASLTGLLAVRLLIHDIYGRTRRGRSVRRKG